jgi:pimeloyl-ACP methyl ester carboxylesterase
MPELRLHGGPLDGLALHYVVEGRGPTVVLLHGLGGFATAWRETVEALAPRLTVYALDLPGFGRSAKPRTRYGLGLFAGALAGFVDALAINHVSLVGHSLGAAVATAYTLARPGRVERLAFVAGLVPGCNYRLSRIYRALALPGVGEALALCGCRPVYRAALNRCFYRPAPETTALLVEEDYATRTAWEARAAYLGTVRGVRHDFQAQGPQFRRALKGLDLPVLLVHGRQDPVVPAAHCVELGAALPRATVRWLESCGHFPQLEHPGTVNEWLGDFIAARPAPR